MRNKKVIHDKVGLTPVAVALSADEQSFVVVERADEEQFIVRNDSLVSSSRKVDFAGRGTNNTNAKVLKSYQEFWHSWRQFHPATERE